MRFSKTLPFLFVSFAFSGGCGPASEPETGAPSGEEAAGESGTSQAAAAVDLSCWLRNGTAEEAMARESPLGETEIDLGGHLGKVCYGRPSARGRVVEGGLIPFGDPWRLGANEATAVHLSFPASVGGIEVEPGSYSLFAIAGEFEWEFVLNSNARRWGIPIDEEVRADDVGTFTGLPRTLTEPVEQLTIDWHTHGGDNGHLVLEWGNTRVEIEVALLDHTH
jgi:hypothetical protein